MLSRYIILILWLTGLTISGSAQGKLAFTVTGASQGKFKAEGEFGSALKDKIEASAIVLDVKSPRDVATGASSGKRQYQPIMIWKPVSASSPQFFKAVATNEVLKEVIIEYYRPDPAFRGRDELVYTIKLTNATVSIFRQIMGNLARENFDADNTLLYDEIGFIFEQIEVTWTKGGIAAQDDWMKRN